MAVTGQCATLSMRADVDAQLEWLARQQPDYLLCYPSTLAELAGRSLTRGQRMPRLREVRTISEVLTPEIRELCEQAWGVPVTDTYSSQEVGQIALQCPAGTLYHVQSEALVVEVLDEEGRPCGPGELGRVVITTLHNFAMPLVRYDIGDYAEIGSPCACGRGLPVLARIAGRARNLLVLADGRRYWPRLGSRNFVEVAPVLQAQYVQKDFDLIEVRLVVAQPLGREQEDRLRQMILPGLPPGMRIAFTYCDRISRGAGGKYEDFVSEVAARR
ncbi:MAG: phenylacetate--CoA ligase family protein [Terriglobales bacterium]